MMIRCFSPKQMQALCWWCDGSPWREKDAIICDGAVRSGKTLCMSLSFILWAFHSNGGYPFAFCGKTIRSLRRNVVTPLLPVLQELGFVCKLHLSENRLTVETGKAQREFYLFGGKDESSAALIQGVTLAGVLFDEAALMPRSFVEQALARCSVQKAKFWFNCNPEHPMHWFYQEWILKAAQKNALYLHFSMEDNPALSPQTLARYRNLYSGVFYRRFVLGEWVAAEGLVYPNMAEPNAFCPPPSGPFEQWAVSCDYGTVNPASFGLWGLCGGVWYRVEEYYYDARKEGASRTDEEHYAALKRLTAGRAVERVVVDPSAASFIEVIRRHGEYHVVPAVNQVLDGIRNVSDALRGGEIRICNTCADCMREFGLYRWADNAVKDAPVKEYDHAMDDVRYFVSTLLRREDAFYVIAAQR